MGTILSEMSSKTVYSSYRERVAMTWVSHQMPDPSFGEDHVSSKRTELEGTVILFPSL